VYVLAISNVHAESARKSRRRKTICRLHAAETGELVADKPRRKLQEAKSEFGVDVGLVGFNGPVGEDETVGGGASYATIATGSREAIAD
jgi:hypothetical protein